MIVRKNLNNELSHVDGGQMALCCGCDCLSFGFAIKFYSETKRLSVFYSMPYS